MAAAVGADPGRDAGEAKVDVGSVVVDAGDLADRLHELGAAIVDRVTFNANILETGA